MKENMVRIWLWMIAIAVPFQIYYWFIYVPRAWKNPGTNKSIDDFREVYEKVYKNGSAFK